MTSQGTQELTQRPFDPRRAGYTNSGLSENDISDVICILIPCSTMALKIVDHTAKTNAQHILQNNGLSLANGLNVDGPSEHETIIVDSSPGTCARDIALRFSSKVNDPSRGFCFGRNSLRCDINLDSEDRQKRVSQSHFRIFLNNSGIIMLEDTSTNGTLVDQMLLGGKRKVGSVLVIKGKASQRVLAAGSIIEILSDNLADVIKFIVRIPSREGHGRAYTDKFHQHIQHRMIAEQRAAALQNGPPMPDGAARGVLAAPLAGPQNTKSLPGLRPLNLSNDFGMHWSGGEEYQCRGVLGKGAFATVYQVATRTQGEVFACKELEKRRFMKNGQLDQRLENEMQIMQALRHPGIVQYIDYRETENHLYIIMEYVPCGDMAGYMQAHGTLPEDLAKEMTRQMLRALAYLHEKNITHRDIKPDNILICSEDPFIVKLTDFGLSKVVKNNETFLKTFCGTLLYCAPEVFPHYDTYVAGQQRHKRRRNTQNSKRSYSQLVDIWSYAAVLWFVLCGQPPVEGVVDANGKGMFNKIMETNLDTSPLLEHKITDSCIDLLLSMLETDPVNRPDELACLSHPWLTEGADGADFSDSNMGLESIPEGEEELDASQLRIHDDTDIGNDESEESQASTESREHKRLKPDAFYAARQPPEILDTTQSYESIPLVNDIHDSRIQSSAPKPQKLFGEISQRALQSSALLGAQNQSAAASFSDNGSLSEFRTIGNVDQHAQMTIREASQPQNSLNPVNGHTVPGFRPSQDPTGGSSWRESMVRELNMDAVMANTGDLNVAQDKTPQQPSHNPQTPSHSQFAAQKLQAESGDQEETPKAPQVKFKRQISIPISASYYYDPHDPSTHNLEYASKVSGLRFSEDGSVLGNDISLPDTAMNSETSSSSENAIHHSGPDRGNGDASALGISVPMDLHPLPRPQTQPQFPPTATTSGFLKPSRFGCLTTTPSSFKQIKIPLARRMTTWGRNPKNTQHYAAIQDTRVAKLALIIVFQADGIAKAEQEGGDWTKLKGMDVVVSTQSRLGIWVNGAHLEEKDAKGRKCYGRVYSGDEICVFKNAEENLTFVCEFSLGSGKRSRKEDNKKFEIEYTSSSFSA